MLTMLKVVSIIGHCQLSVESNSSHTNNRDKTSPIIFLSVNNKALLYLSIKNLKIITTLYGLLNSFLPEKKNIISDFH